MYIYKGKIICANHALGLVGEVTELYSSIFDVPQHLLPQPTDTVDRCHSCIKDPI